MKKIALISGGVIVLGVLAYFGYKWYQKSNQVKPTGSTLPTVEGVDTGKLVKITNIQMPTPVNYNTQKQKA